MSIQRNLKVDWRKKWRKLTLNDLNVGFIVLLFISRTTDGLVRNRKYLELFQAYIERLSSTFLSYIMSFF